MAVRDVVTAGFGNGTFSGSIGFVVTRGYSIAQAAVITSGALFFRGKKVSPLFRGDKVGPLVRGSKVGPLIRCKND